MVTIIFDFDGTIANSLPLCVSCLNLLSKEYGHKAIDNLEQVELFRNKKLENIIKQDLNLSWYQYYGYGKKLKQMISEQSAYINCFDGIKELIETLSKDYKIGIITSNLETTVKNVLEKAGIKNIDFIFSSKGHSSIKQIVYGKSSVIKEFLNKNNLDKNNVLYISDEVRDIQACKKVGIKMLAVTWGYNSKELLAKEQPDYLVDEPVEILKILQKR